MYPMHLNITERVEQLNQEFPVYLKAVNSFAVFAATVDALKIVLTRSPVVLDGLKQSTALRSQTFLYREEKNIKPSLV